MRKAVMVCGLMLVFSGMAQPLQWVTIGDPGNAADTVDGDEYTDGDQHYGAVDYTYSISKTEVSIAQFQASGVGDGDEDVWNDGERTVGTDAPVCNVTWEEAMKYCNWLTTGDTNSGAYQFDDGIFYLTVMTRQEILRDGGVYYVLPTIDEWYKAAYYDPSTGTYSLYADGTSDTESPPPSGGGATGWNYDSVNTLPHYTRAVGLGSLEQNGTVNMMGNVAERTDDIVGGLVQNMVKGGMFSSAEDGLRSTGCIPIDGDLEYWGVGFRVVAIPKPGSVIPTPVRGKLTAWMVALGLVSVGMVGFGYWAWRKTHGT